MNATGTTETSATGAATAGSTAAGQSGHRVADAARRSEAEPGGIGHLLRSIPPAVWLVALLAGVVHMAPYWRAAAETPDGWTFTANLSASPDYMQYRVWMRQTQDEGVLVSNRFTTEPNGRHLPVVLYWSIGRIAAVSGLTPEWTYAWLGGLLAVAFTVLLFAVVRHFAPGPRATAWIFGTLLVGGGLGGYIKLLEGWDWARGFAFVNTLLFRPLSGAGRTALFEDYRGNYIVQALFDTHFLLFWLLTTAAVLGLYVTIRRFSYLRLCATAALFALGTFLHVYEGLTLLFIAAGVLFMCTRRGLPPRRALVIAAVCAAAVGAVLLALVAVFRASGALAPSWRGLDMAPSILLMAYPLAWALIAWGGVRYWQRAGLDEAFLVGWALGCLALIASGPFFPYPDRGTMTLQIPLFLIAGSIFFAARQRVGAAAAVVVALMLGATPVWMADSWNFRTTFKAHETHKWMSPDHVAMTAVLSARATPADVLLAGEVPLRWLAPDYRGRHYAGHFFLTHRHEQKRVRMQAFYQSREHAEQAAFLRDAGITLVFVPADTDRGHFRALAGMHVLDERPFGTLFTFGASARE